jgi:hypothetical protein
MSKMSVSEAKLYQGCWLEGSRGWTAIAALIDIAVGYGMELDSDDKAIFVAYCNGQERLILSTGEDVDVAGCVIDQGGLVDQADDYLNDKVAPAGWCFGWCDGEYFLMPTEWRQDE